MTVPVEKKLPLLVVLGPTAVGKTDLSVDLAEAMHTEIVSGDSMLIYRGFDVGTAKPTVEERRGVPHHLIDILDGTESYTVTDFQREAAACIARIAGEGKIPILAGGTGLYVKALLEGYQFNRAEEHPAFRAAMRQRAETEGKEAVYRLLEQQDPKAAAEIDPQNFRRVVRALETVRYGGESISRQRAGSTQDTLVYHALVLGLHRDRQALYARINRRVERMFADGLVAEVRHLLTHGITRTAPAMKGIGYKETAAYLAGEITREQAVETIQTNTRHFAKRQLTWYRRMPYIHWIDVDGLTREELLRKALYEAEGFFPFSSNKNNQKAKIEEQSGGNRPCQ